MPRKVKSKDLDTREARGKLKTQGKPHYRMIEPGLHLGYRKLKGRAGTWLVRHYLGKQTYEVERIATADDLSDADGVAILNFKQAQDEARKRMVSRAHKAVGKSGPFTVADAMDAYLEYLETNGKSAVTARYRAKAFIYPALGPIEVEKLTTDQLRKWQASIVKMAPRWRGIDRGQFKGDEDARRRRKVSANRILAGILKPALNHAFNDGKVSSDKAWRKVKPFKGVKAARARYLTIPECQRLINASNVEFRSLVQAALLTGCRYGELTRLEVADFNRDAKTLAVRQSKSSNPRHVVLTDEGAAFFARLCVGRAGEIMLRKDDGEAWGTSEQAYQIAQACKRAKIEPPINFHQLRHTWASHAVMNGVPLLVVAKNLGHKDTRMVEEHYGHLAPSYVADEIRKGAPTFGIEPETEVAALDERRTRNSGHRAG